MGATGDRLWGQQQQHGCIRGRRRCETLIPRRVGGFNQKHLRHNGHDIRCNDDARSGRHSHVRAAAPSSLLQARTLTSHMYRSTTSISSTSVRTPPFCPVPAAGRSLSRIPKRDGYAPLEAWLSYDYLPAVPKRGLLFPALPEFVWVDCVGVLSLGSPETGSRGIFSLGTSGSGVGRVSRCKIELSTRGFWGSKIHGE